MDTFSIHFYFGPGKPKVRKGFSESSYNWVYTVYGIRWQWYKRAACVSVKQRFCIFDSTCRGKVHLDKINIMVQ